MRKILSMVVLMLGVTFTANSQAELKGYVLGQNYSGDEQIMTSLGGIEGALIISTLKDTRIYALMFAPSKDGKSVTRVHEADVTRMVNGLSTKFGVKMRFTPKDDYDDNEGWYAGSVEDTKIMVSKDCNEYRDIPCEMSVYLFSEHLNGIADKEKQEEANTDF